MKRLPASFPLLPPPGRWALGRHARAHAEQLLAAARAQRLRTAWLGMEASFLSNLSVLENLRLMHDWHHGHPAAFAGDLQLALDTMALALPDWLHQRPAQLPDAQLAAARFLRLLLLRADVVVLHPAALEQAGAAMAERLLVQLDGARIFLLDLPAPNWPAWPAHDMLAASSGEAPA